MLLKDALHLFEESLYDGQTKETTRTWYIWFDEQGRIHGTLQHLLHFFGDVELEEIDVFAINRWVKGLSGVQSKWGQQRPTVESELSPNTINGRIASAKRFFGWLYQTGLIDRNPTATLQKIPMGKRAPRAITTDDFIRLLEHAAQASKQPTRDLAILIFLYDTGCRIGGLCNIKMSDLVLSERRVYIHEKGRGYNGDGRWLFLEPTPFLALTAYLEVRPVGCGSNLFVSPKGNLTVSGVYQMIQRHADALDIEGFWNPHSFRHAAAREWLRGGASLPAVAQLLGHKNVQTTASYYAQWARSELQQIKHEASPFNNAQINGTVNRLVEKFADVAF